MRRLPINSFHYPVPVSLPCRATANYHPRPAHEAVLECSAPLLLASRPPSCTLSPHPAPTSAPTPA
jgi:hypothetical protein